MPLSGRLLHARHHRRWCGHGKPPGVAIFELFGSTAQPGSGVPRRIVGMAEAQDSLTDGALQSEIELVGDLVVAATSSDGPLPQQEIDRLLGVKTVPEVEAGHDVEASHEDDQGDESTPAANGEAIHLP